MKTFALKRLSLATALVLASATSFAQSPTNPITIPTMPELSASALDIATLAGQQTQMVSDIITKVHEQVGNATRNLLGGSSETMNPDELEAALVERIPGFAGWIHRDDGTTVMRLAGIKAADAATALSRLPSATALVATAGSKVTVQAALFDSRQLLDFKNKAFSLASVDGVLATWINRETNRVEVRYNSDLNPSAIEALTNQLVGAGIPRAALVLHPGEIATSASATGVSVQAQKIPLAAGSQIYYSLGSGTDICTLGVPAIRSGVRGFVTASHCSNNTYGLENPSKYADSGNTTIIGDESVDPKGATCPSSFKGLTVARGCRKADALFVKTTLSNAVDFGKLLVTPGANNLIVSKIINITGTQSNPTVGQLVYKTGRTTGTTSAKVARICVDSVITDARGATYGVVCQSEVDSAGFVDGGDSGAPVWLSKSGGAVITGIVAYKMPGVVRGFSPWSGVTADLGSLTIK